MWLQCKVIATLAKVQHLWFKLLRPIRVEREELYYRKGETVWLPAVHIAFALYSLQVANIRLMTQLIDKIFKIIHRVLKM